jgi:glycosyltransferase involved in cell wall biosynthesis
MTLVAEDVRALAAASGVSQHQRLRIAWVGHKSTQVAGGIATYSRETIRLLREGGHHVTYFHHQTPGQPDLPGEVSLRSLPILGTARYSPAATKRAFGKAVRAGRFDVVHASFWFSSLDFELPRLCQEAGVPLVVTFHLAFGRPNSLWGGISSALYRLYGSVLADCDRVIVFSDAQRELLTRIGVRRDAIRVVPNGVDLAKFRPGSSDWRQRVGTDRYFLYMGRLDLEKNVQQLIDAFLDVDPPSTTRLLIAGSGGERRRLMRRFGDPRVQFLGHIADEADRISLLRGAEAFFLPSSVEGLSLAMLEAMACGAATVVSDVGGDGDAVRGAGIVIDPAELAAELRLAIRLLLEMPWLARELGRAARRRAEGRYSLERNVDSLASVYEEVANRPPSVPARAVGAVRPGQVGG